MTPAFAGRKGRQALPQELLFISRCRIRQLIADGQFNRTREEFRFPCWRTGAIVLVKTRLPSIIVSIQTMYTEGFPGSR